MNSSNKLFCFLLFIVLVTMLSFSTQLMAQDIHEQFPEHYPTSFDGKGNINRIVSDKAVIGDRQYSFQSNITFNTPDIQNCSRYMIEKGDYVGYLLDREGNIVSLWRLNEFFEER